jgi:hypothetical protein
VAYVCRLLSLTCLAPDIVEAILDGRQPRGVRPAKMLGTDRPSGKSSDGSTASLRITHLRAKIVDPVLENRDIGTKQRQGVERES